MEATTTVAKAIMSAPTGSGTLTATILSAYDLPDDDIPSCVHMSFQAPGGYSEESTGPPAAKHRDHVNSFKFGGSSSAENRLVLSAPLPELFQATVTFTLAYANSAKNLSAKCTVSKTLRVNETQWLILNLDSENKTVRGDTPPASGTSSVGDQPPTLRLKLRLDGPHRPEISAIINLCNAWFGAVDVVSGATVGAASGLVRDLPLRTAALGKLLLIPTVPAATLAVAALPIVGGLLVVGLPFLLPVLILAVLAAAVLGAAGSALYFSTRDGRTRLQGVAEPTYQTFLMTTTGQRIVYDVGPRPSPQALAHAVLPSDMIGKLVVSLLIDLVGSASYLIPLAGEAFDLSWAPISMVLVGALYDDVAPSLKYVALIEELLPFTDWIPSATLGWAKEFMPNLLEQGKRKMDETRTVGRREKEALMSMAR